MPLSELRKNDMMAHLLDGLESGEDIGHFGRLVFAMVARFFADEREVVAYLQKDPSIGEEDAKALYQEVLRRDYSPPQRRQILEWQGRQSFPLCPTPADPDSCNVYENLEFPEGVYEHIKDYYRQKGRAAS